MRVAVPLAVTLLLLLGPAAAAQEAQGFAELRVGYQAGVTGTKWQLVERVRPTFSSELFERVKLVATIEGGLAQGRDSFAELERTLRESELWPVLEASGWESPQYANSLLRLNSADDYLDVDRLYLDVYGGGFDLRVGRQALNWGSGQFFNPTDPFPEVLLAEPWRPRRGVNAVRLNVPFGTMRDASLVVATNDTLDAVRAAGRVRVNWAGQDFALVGAWRGGEGNQALVGVDLRGNLEVGWWLEAAYLLGDDPHEELTVGLDYSFPILERATVFAQYYRNGAGSKEVSPTGLLGLGAGASLPGSRRERDPFAPFTRGRDYALLGSSLGILEELSTSVALLQNLNDGSGMAIPTVSYAALDWLEVAGSAQVPYSLWGTGGELRPRREDLRLSLPVGSSGETLSADLGGLVPTATFTLWTRITY